MPDETSQWTPSQKQAFSYARQGINLGLSGAKALKDFRLGGGSIRTQDWYDLYRFSGEIKDWSDTITVLPDNYEVKESMHTETPWDFREQYVVQMEVGGYSDELGVYVRKYVTVESDKLLTRGEWERYAQEAITDTVGSIQFTIERVYNFNAMKRTW